MAALTSSRIRHESPWAAICQGCIDYINMHCEQTYPNLTRTCCPTCILSWTCTIPEGRVNIFSHDNIYRRDPTLIHILFSYQNHILTPILNTILLQSGSWNILTPILNPIRWQSGGGSPEVKFWSFLLNMRWSSCYARWVCWADQCQKTYSSFVHLWFKYLVACNLYWR